MADPVQETERVHQGRNKWGKMVHVQLPLLEEHNVHPVGSVCFLNVFMVLTRIVTN